MGFGDVWRAVRQQGGIFRSIKALVLRDSLKYGKHVGTDDYGNRYYENNDYFFLRNRWVEYADHVGFNYDASQIPPEWFGWLHHRTDLTPDKDPTRPKYHWMMPHEENMSGTPGQYVPYTTTRPVIHPWVPPKPGDKGACPPSDNDGDGGSGCGERRERESCPESGGEVAKTPVCEREEVEKECDEVEEKKPQPCEKPVTAFH